MTPDDYSNEINVLEKKLMEVEDRVPEEIRSERADLERRIIELEIERARAASPSGLPLIEGDLAVYDTFLSQYKNSLLQAARPDGKADWFGRMIGFSPESAPYTVSNLGGRNWPMEKIMEAVRGKDLTIEITERGPIGAENYMPFDDGNRCLVKIEAHLRVIDASGKFTGRPGTVLQDEDVTMLHVTKRTYMAYVTVVYK